MKSEGQGRWFWLEICALLAVVQVVLAGYQFDVGNQPIQVSFLKRFMDPGLFPRDLLMATVPDYPSYFFQGLAMVLRDPAWIETAYLFLHLVTSFALMTAVWVLAHSIYRSHAVAFGSVLLVTAGHHAGLGESGLYSQGFTHTGVALPIAVFSIAMLFRGRPLIAFALAGILANIHALTATYLAAILVVWAAWNIREAGLRRTAAWFAAMAFLGLPTWIRLAVGSDGWDANWAQLLWARSSHHVRISSQWTTGVDRIPHFLLVTAMGLLCLAAAPPERRASRTLAILTSVLIVLVTAGAFVGELFPVAAALRAQLLRASGLLVLLILPAVAQAGAAAVEGCRRAEPGTRAGWFVEAAVLALVFVVIAVPALADMQWAVLALCAIVFLIRGKLPWPAALLTGVVLAVCTVAHVRIGFPWWGVRSLGIANLPTGWQAALAGLTATVLLAAAGPYIRRGGVEWTLRLATLALFGFLAGRVFEREYATWAFPDSWRQVQTAAAQYTARDSLILTPAMPGGFRLHSDRSIVGEWRDGTQQFFSPAFAELWWQRMQDLRPGIRYDPVGRRWIARGGTIGDLSDEQLEGLWKKYRADYVVVPSGRPRSLPVVYRNADWMLCKAERIPPPPPPPPPAGVTNAVEWWAQERFLAEVVRPNIEKHRKSDVVLRVIDEQGRPLRGRRYEVRQVSSSFRFSCVLPHFMEPPAPADFRMPPVSPEELARFKEIFNWSVIGYSGKWNVIEPEEGKPSFEHLDRYVNWCATNQIGLEFHFVSGYEPAWLKKKTADEKQKLFLDHARVLVERYRDRMQVWQVVNEGHLLQQAPAVFKLMRELDPRASLGISHCARFYSDRPAGPQQEKDLCQGMDGVKWLRSRDTPVDFFGLHGHRPFGLWADVREMYRVLDMFRKENLRVHISEFGMHENHPIVGPVRRGQWNAELQAEYYRRYYTVCFSHPIVDEINLWGMGPQTWMAGSGLLDRDFKPKPAFHALRQLITEEWRTRQAGVVGLDGSVRFRGFHGGYEVIVKGSVPGSDTVARFEVVPDRASEVTIRCH